jgi:ubiquinone/menaquinone biosynthesis C-methylase UbiE
MTTVGTRNEATRIAWLENALKQIPAGVRILDAGAGELAFKKFCNHLTYVAQDFAQYDGQGDARGLQTGSWDQSKLDLICDITAITEPDASFDAVMCIEVFEHLPEPVLAIKEFSRLLKPGGKLIITAPFCCLTHFAPYHYYTGFNRYFYEKHLTEHGFVIDELVENGNFFEYMAQEIRRIPDITANYSDGSTTRIERFAVSQVLKMLERFSAADKGSAELLHFGCFVRATKRWVNSE